MADRCAKWRNKITESLKGNKHHFKNAKIEIKCKNCGKIFKDFRGNKRKFCSRKCANVGKITKEFKEKISKTLKGRTSWNKGKKFPQFSGKNSPNWKGGNSRWYKELYWTPQYLKWRKEVFERDFYTCQVCRKVGIYLTAHHIKSWAKYPELRFNIDNGITLCDNCHKLTDNYKGRGKK